MPKYRDLVLPLIEEFIVRELRRYRLNIKRGGTYKVTTSILKQYLRGHFEERHIEVKDEVLDRMLIPITQYLPIILNRYGYELVYSHKGTYIVRRVGSDGDA